MPNYSSGGGLPLTPVIRILLITNVAVFLLQQVSPMVTQWGALHPWGTADFRLHQLVTMMFMHGGFAHILFNMFALVVFGSVLENFWGSKRFFNFYMICGIAASVLTLLTVNFSGEMFIRHALELPSEVPVSSDYLDQYKSAYSALGASGAIMGVMAAFAYLFPNTELYMMFIPIPIKAKYLVPGFVLLDLFGGFGYGMKGDNVAHFAHIGGAVMGLIIVMIWNKTNRKNFY